jgi:hypothetical protein
MEKTSKINFYSLIIDTIGLVSIGIICILYSIFWSNFAETHISLPFLDFPIFIGELILGGCIVLVAVKWKITGMPSNRWFLLLAGYMIWMLSKALWGYYTCGALALRNAALFYYPMFAFLIVQFLRTEFTKQWIIYTAFSALIFMKAHVGFVEYFLFPYFALCMVLILKMHNRWGKLIALLAVIYFFPYKMFFQGSRSYVLGNFSAFLFLSLAWIFGLLRFQRKYKIMLFSVMLTVLFIGLLTYAKKTQLKSLTTPFQIMEELRQTDAVILERKKHFERRELKAQLFHRNVKEVGGPVSDGNAKQSSPTTSVSTSTQTLLEVEQELDAIIAQLEHQMEAYQSQLRVEESLYPLEEATIEKQKVRESLASLIEEIKDTTYKQRDSVLSEISTSRTSEEREALTDKVKELSEEYKQVLYDKRSAVLEEVHGSSQTVKPVETTVSVSAAVAMVEPLVEEAKPVIEVVKPVKVVLSETIEEAKPLPEVSKPEAMMVAEPLVEEAKPVIEVVKPVKVVLSETIEEAKPLPEVSKPEAMMVAEPLVEEARPVIEVVKPVKVVLSETIEEAKPEVEVTASIEAMTIADQTIDQLINDAILHLEKQEAMVLEKLSTMEQQDNVPADPVQIDSSSNVSSTISALPTTSPARDIESQPKPLVPVPQGRALAAEHGNMLFRLLIWRDMIVEMMEARPFEQLFGFNFGRPQRSISLEVANIAVTEWQRDGWITPHNVFLHMVYRAGIVGLVIILGIIGTLFYLTRVFLQSQSLSGIIMVSILLYWLVVANFLVVLELPYQAIPFWSFWGLAMWHGLMIKSSQNPKPSMAHSN